MTKQYLIGLPECTRKSKWDQAIQDLKWATDEEKIQLTAAEYHEQIKIQRQRDLNYYRVLLKNKIPKDYILEQAYEIIDDLANKRMDYDEEIINDDENTLHTLRTLSIIFKAQRQNIIHCEK